MVGLRDGEGDDVVEGADAGAGRVGYREGPLGILCGIGIAVSHQAALAVQCRIQPHSFYRVAPILCWCYLHLCSVFGGTRPEGCPSLD